MGDKKSWAPLQFCPLLSEGPNSHHGVDVVRGSLSRTSKDPQLPQLPAPLSSMS